MKKRKPKIIKDKKLRGEWAEMKFMARAAEYGLTATKPWGESRAYDFIVGRPGHFVTVQVKSTANASEGGYVCHVGAGRGSYAPHAFDFGAVYVVPDDVWYIIPETKIRGMRCISVYPRSDQAKYEQYREAWNLLREATGTQEPAIMETAVTTHPAKIAQGGAASVALASGTFPLKPSLNGTPAVDEGSSVFVKRMESAFNFFRTQLEKGAGPGK